MRAITREQHPTVAEPIDASAGKLVDRYPLKLKVGLRPQHLAHPRLHPLGLALFNRVSIPSQLKVDPPDVIALLVQQRRLARMKRRIEPEPALGRKLGLHQHIRDQKAILKRLPGERRAHHRTCVAVGAVAGDHPGSDGLVAPSGVSTPSLTDSASCSSEATR